MGRGQKIVTTALWGVVVLAMVGFVTLWATRRDNPSLAGAPDSPVTGVRLEQPEDSLPALFPAPPFQLTDQTGKTMRTADLHGSVWTAILFFTECNGVCPGMTGRMVELQQAVPSEKVKLVSFTVDPAKDTPEVLAKYAQRVGAKPGQWFFLTGTTEQMFATAKGFNLAATPATESEPILHSEKVLLIDKSGTVRGIYDTRSDSSMGKLARDAVTLAEAP